MSEISQEYSDDEDIAPYNNNVHWPNSDAESEEDSEAHDDRAEEGPIDADGYHGDRQSVSSSSDIGGSDEVISRVVRGHVVKPIGTISIIPLCGDSLKAFVGESEIL